MDEASVVRTFPDPTVKVIKVIGCSRNDLSVATTYKREW
jgi:hypothetical protein